MNATAAKPNQRRWLATIGLLLLASALGRVALPGVDLSMLARTGSLDRTSLSLVALGLAPFLAAAFLVELDLLIRRSVRPLRAGTNAKRAGVRRRVVRLTFALALVQAYFITYFLESLPGDYQLIPLPGWLSRAAIITSLVAGVAILLGLARYVERVGLGNGIAVMLTGAMIPELFKLLGRQLSELHMGDASLLGVLVQMGVLGLIVLVTIWMLGLLPNQQRPLLAPPRPTAGIAPLMIAAAVLNLPGQLQSLRLPIPSALVLAPGQSGYRDALLVLCIALGVGLSLLFHRRTPAEDDDARRAVRQRTIFESVLGVTGLALLGIMLQKWGIAAGLVPLVAHATATVLDMRIEARIRAQHGELSAIGQWASISTIDECLATLRAEGITVFPRGLQVRKLYYVFGPHVQIDLLVPIADAERATQILERVTA